MFQSVSFHWLVNYNDDITQNKTKYFMLRLNYEVSMRELTDTKDRIFRQVCAGRTLWHPWLTEPKKEHLYRVTQYSLLWILNFGNFLVFY